MYRMEEKLQLMHQLPMLVMLVMLATLVPVMLAMAVPETVVAAVVMVVVTAAVENEYPALQSSLRCKTTKRQFLPVCDQKC